MRQSFEVLTSVMFELATKQTGEPKALKEARNSILFMAELTDKLLHVPEFKPYYPAFMFAIVQIVNSCLDTQFGIRAEFLANGTCAMQVLKLVGPIIDELTRNDPAVVKV